MNGLGRNVLLCLFEYVRSQLSRPFHDLFVAVHTYEHVEQHTHERGQYEIDSRSTRIGRRMSVCGNYASRGQFYSARVRACFPFCSDDDPSVRREWRSDFCPVRSGTRTIGRERCCSFCFRRRHIAHRRSSVPITDIAVNYNPKIDRHERRRRPVKLLRQWWVDICRGRDIISENAMLTTARRWR